MSNLDKFARTITLEGLAKEVQEQKKVIDDLLLRVRQLEAMSRPVHSYTPVFGGTSDIPPMYANMPVNVSSGDFRSDTPVTEK